MNNHNKMQVEWLQHAGEKAQVVFNTLLELISAALIDTEDRR